jgi:hypothetical protein
MSVTTTCTPSLHDRDWRAKKRSSTRPERPGRTATTGPVSASETMVENPPWPLRSDFSSTRITRQRTRRRRKNTILA